MQCWPYYYWHIATPVLMLLNVFCRLSFGSYMNSTILRNSRFEFTSKMLSTLSVQCSPPPATPVISSYIFWLTLPLEKTWKMLFADVHVSQYFTRGPVSLLALGWFHWLWVINSNTLTTGVTITSPVDLLSQGSRAVSIFNIVIYQ